MSPVGHASRRPLVRLVVAAATAFAVLGAGGARPAAAHTEVEFTLPTDGAAVGDPLGEVTVGFTEAVTLIGPGFEVLDPDGNLVIPFVVTDDDRVFRLQLDPPLAGGEAAVRFEVRARDGHTITGGFAFTVTAEPPTSVATPTTSPPTSAATTVGPTTAAPGPASPTASSAATLPSSTDRVPASSEPSGSSDASSTGAYVGIGVVVALAAAVFLVVRARSTPPR